jgi:hypothetical protein
MASVMAALEPHDDIGLLGEPIDDLPCPRHPTAPDHNNIRHANFSARASRSMN